MAVVLTGDVPLTETNTYPQKWHKVQDSTYSLTINRSTEF